MSNYTRNQIVDFGVSSISKILPLDEETLKQMVESALNELQTREAMYKYFTDLIGDEPDCIEFISRFQSMVFDVAVSEPKKKTPVPKVSKVPNEKPKVKSAWDKPSTQETKQVHNARLSKSSSSTTTSELLDLKPSTKLKSSTSKGSKKRILKNLEDVESALAQLEISDGRGKAHRVCNCMGTRHPLFEFYPNCLNCGKIICAKEGLQPCSFCGHEILSEKEKLDILNVLTEEKLELNGRAKPTKIQPQQQKSKKKDQITISINAAGEHNSRKQDFIFKKLELQREKELKAKQQKEEEEKKVKEQEAELKYFKERQDHDPELLKAQERLDTLLNFQSTGAERTKIIDRASDFDAPGRTASLWSSPMERALQLKKQQRQLRKQQELEKERSGRGRKVLDMSIKDGKVILREQVTRTVLPSDADGSDDEIAADSEEEEDLKTIKQLQSEISKEKLKEESQKINTYWDYEKDKTRWEKPVYQGALASPADSDDPTPEVDELNRRLHFSRVQLGGDGKDEEEMVISLPTL